MNHNSAAHLSEEALNDLLIGIGAPESERHLEGCAECRARVDQFDAEMELLNQTTRAWSNYRAERMESAPGKPATRRAVASWAGVFGTGARKMPLATMGWATTAVLAAAIVLPVWRTHHQPPVGSMTPATAQQQETEEQIAQDDQLMREVDAAINANEESPLGAYSSSKEPHPRQEDRAE
jgi:anti-sigma factor RsiW